MKNFLVLFLFLFTISCTHIDRVAKLEVVSEKVNKSKNIASGKKIEIVVVDERKNPEILGKKKFGSEEVKITPDQELSEFLERKLAEGFQKKGFEIAKGKTLTVYLERFKYKAERFFPLGKSSIEGKISATVLDKNGNEIFRKKFNISGGNSHFISSTEKKDEEIINFALQELYNELLNDEGLMKNLQL